jgi:hypothetical protein
MPTSSSILPGGVAAPLTALGVWRVDGKDMRGTYTGLVELAREGVSLRFARTVSYDGIVVEGDRTLSVAWTGELSGLGDDACTLRGSLDPRGFVRQRGDLVRTISDAVTQTEAVVSRTAKETRARWRVGAQSFDEVWSEHKPSGSAPIFRIEREVRASHAPPNASERATSDATFATYRSLPSVAPYATRPAFQSAVFGRVYDRTDFDFYRQNPKVIRVVNKPVDAISTQEALVRANAFGSTLAQKAKNFDAEMEADFIDPGVWFAPDSRMAGGIESSVDGALWTATYVASQIYRFEVTGETAAKSNAKRSLEGVLKLQEITGDVSRFARTLRKTNGPAVLPWHAGTGAFLGLDWLEGGNNDMLKGLQLAYTLGYPFFCEAADKAQHTDLCSRMRINMTNLRSISADNVQGSGGNQAVSVWLEAAMTGDLSLRLKAEQSWPQERIAKNAYAVEYRKGIADWSGTHLTFVGSVVESNLARRLDLGGNAVDTVGDFIDRSHENLVEQRLVTWHFLRQKFGKTKPTATQLEDGLWRLREVPFPKPEIAIDHRVDPAFCMAPYPALPWKNDWESTNRTQSLVGYPAFEDEMGVMMWKNGMTYAFDSRSRRYPGTDYLHLYWFGRKHGMIAASE